MTSNLNQVQDVVYLSGERDGRACEQLVEKDRDGIEPVEGLGG